jgi:hypothetical protein
VGRSICAPGGTSWPTTSPSPPRCWSVFIHRSESNLGPELGPAHHTVINASRSGQQGRATARGGSHRANRRVCRQSCTRPVFWSPTRQQPALGQGLGGTKTGNESPLAPCSLYTNDMMVAIVSPPAALDRRVGMLVLVARWAQSDEDDTNVPVLCSPSRVEYKYYAPVQLVQFYRYSLVP